MEWGWRFSDEDLECDGLDIEKRDSIGGGDTHNIDDKQDPSYVDVDVISRSAHNGEEESDIPHVSRLVKCTAPPVIN